jgi:glycosyltransferase involved in cell wall biosynthesis
MQKLSIVVPVLNEVINVPIFYKKIKEIQAKIKPAITIDFWYIDDGSTDKTLAEIKKLKNKDKNVHFVSFSRNFGKEAAIYAGLQHAKGDFVALMDVDLQDPPSLLPKMMEGVVSGEYDSVGARRTSRDGEAPIRSFFARLFYGIVSKISGTHLVDGARDFRVMSRPMVDAILQLQENQRFSKGIFSWVGFKTKYLPYKNIEREAGKSNWSFWSLTKYAIEGMISFSTLPLTLVTWVGVLSLLSAIGIGSFVVFRALFSNVYSISGWPSTITTILFFGGIQMISLGIVGRYIASIYHEVKRRPVYLEREEG